MLSEERITNYALYLILDSMLESWEKGLEQERLNFLDMRSKPECVSYIVNWVKGHKKFLRQTQTTLHNAELERLTLDGILLCYAQYYNNGKLIDGTKNSIYAKEMSDYYKADIAERKEIEEE